MTLSHIELQKIYDEFLEEKIKNGIEKFMEQNLDEPDYLTDSLWELDFMIGGIGRYCMPPNPVNNPFPAGIERELYRPLQYARSNIDICDVRMQARFVIESAGMHLEAACRLYLKEKCALGNMRFYNTTLGKAVNKIKQIGEFEANVINALQNFVSVYNRSKHEINQDDSRERLFNAYDAITVYFTVRVLGLIILKSLGVSESFNKYMLCYTNSRYIKKGRRKENLHVPNNQP